MTELTHTEDHDDDLYDGDPSTGEMELEDRASLRRVRACDTRSSAFAVSADCRSSSKSLAFSTATATCEASASTTRRSSASNCPRPSFATEIVPTTREPNFRIWLTTASTGG